MEEDEVIYREYLHSPSHLFIPNAAYIVTCGTNYKQHYFDRPEKLDYLQHCIFEGMEKFGWKLQAWALLSNHYDVIAHAPPDAKKLPDMLRSIHSKSAVWLNRLDGSEGREVWYRYRDTCLTYPTSYYARLNYVHNNPVKHGIVPVAEQYPWCSMAWFQQNAKPSFVRTVSSFKWDQVQIEDDF